MTTWVLLRGLLRDSRHWGEFPQQLQRAIGAPHLVMLDFPGNGSLHQQASAISVPEMAQHIRTQLRQLGYPPPYAVLALSLGAMVAVEWSAQHPQELERMVLINTSLAPHNRFYQRLRPANYPALLRFLIYGSIAQRERLILRLTSTTPRTLAQRAELLACWTRYAESCPVSRINILRQLRAALNYRATANAPTVPLLLLGGQQDRLVSVACTLTLAQLWRCNIKLHPTAGHDLPLDDADWVIRQIQQWRG